MHKTQFQPIHKMYDKLNYFDQYGASVLLFIIISFFFIFAISYCFVIIYTQPIIDNWASQRCKPYIIPFAGFITHPHDMTPIQYTAQNFNYCTQNILSSITGMAIQPLSYIIYTYQFIVSQINTEIDYIRSMFFKIRYMFQQISQEIMGRIINITIPLQQIIISFKDLISKIQGTMTAALFTLLGSYYTLKSLMGAIAQFIIIILISLASMIAVFWVLPVTWGLAVSNTVIFIAIAIPMAIILAFMTDVLHVKTNLNIPTVKCFDEDTILLMNDGTKQKISNIKVGDLLLHNNQVTAYIKVETNGSNMFILDDIIVSDSHIVYFDNKWIPVSKHPLAKPYLYYQKPFLFCLNTSNKIIHINNTIFTDWDEIFYLYNKQSLIHNLNKIPSLLYKGFYQNTPIKLNNTTYKVIKDIQVGDILDKGQRVYGVVTILGNNSNSQLYHLLTDSKTFFIHNYRIYDYNAAIDLF